MTLDVTVPDSPPLSGPPLGAAYNNVTPPDAGGVDYRRDELASALEAGVWADGFEAWAAETGLTESEFALLVRHAVLEQLDFYWDPAAETVGYRVPSPSDDVCEGLAADSDDIEAELDSLARLVSVRLEADGPVRNEG